MAKFSYIHFRITEQEKSLLEKEALSLGMKLSTYVRFMLLDHDKNADKKENSFSPEFTKWISENYKELFQFLIKGAGMSAANIQLNVPEEIHTQLLNRCREKYNELNIGLNIGASEENGNSCQE